MTNEEVWYVKIEKGVMYVAIFMLTVLIMCWKWAD